MAELDSIREFVKSNLIALDEKASLADDDNIFELGLVDSPFAIQLVTWIEKEFGIHVEDCELDIANFQSVECIADFVRRRRGGSG